MGDIVVVPCLGTAVSTWTTPCEALRRFDSPNTIPRSGMRAVIGGGSGIMGLRGRACVRVCESWSGCCLHPETGLDSGRPGPSQEPEAQVHADRAGYLSTLVPF